MSRILVTDDHTAFRKRVVQVIAKKWPQIDVDEAADGEQALALVKKRGYSVVLLDIAMQGMGGLEVLRKMKNLRPEVPVLILGIHTADEYGETAVRDGAAGYLAKDQAVEELTDAVRTVAAGGQYIGTLAEKGRGIGRAAD